MCQSHEARQWPGGMTKINVEDAVGTRLAHDITEIRPGEFKGPSFRRGHRVREQDLCRLMRLGKRHLYILDLKDDQVHEDDAVLEPDPQTGRTLLRKGADREKDQSYFLFALTAEQRAVADFPLGRLTKREVRELAREMGIAAAERAESMDLCFVPGSEDYRRFLRRSGLAPGD